MFGDIIFILLIVATLGSLGLCWWVENGPKKSQKAQDEEETVIVEKVEHSIEKKKTGGKKHA